MKLSGLMRRTWSRCMCLLHSLIAVVALVGVSLGSNAALAQEAGDAAAGERIAHTCLGCHGVEHYVNVYPSYHVPLIAGQQGDYLSIALKAYRSGERVHATMQANAGLLTDQDIADISAWLSSAGGEYSSDRVGDAPAVAGTCVACHGETGVSPAGQWPNLAGQYKSYLEHTLKAYRSGARQNAIMAGIASALSDDDIDDLADYFSAQEGPLRTAPTNN